MNVFTKGEFAKNIDDAMKAAASGPVFITEHGEPKHVVLKIDDYDRIRSGDVSLAEALAMPGLSEAELDWSMPDEQPGAPSFP